MIDGRTARRLREQIAELRRRRVTRESARAVQRFVSEYEGAPAVVPHRGDFRIRYQGERVSLREAKKREAREREELVKTATQLHRLLDKRIVELAELGRRAFNEGKIKETDAEGYEEARQRLQELFSKESPFPRYAALGAARAKVPADALMEAVELLHEIVSAMAEEHASRMAERDQRIREGRPDPGGSGMDLGMDGAADVDVQDDQDDEPQPDGDGESWRVEQNYRWAPDPAQSCATCTHFDEAASRCALFDAAVRSVDVCDSWSQRASEEAREAVKRWLA